MIRITAWQKVGNQATMHDCIIRECDYDITEIIQN